MADMITSSNLDTALMRATSNNSIAPCACPTSDDKSEDLGGLTADTDKESWKTPTESDEDTGTLFDLPNLETIPTMEEEDNNKDRKSVATEGLQGGVHRNQQAVQNSTNQGQDQQVEKFDVKVVEWTREEFQTLKDALCDQGKRHEGFAWISRNTPGFQRFTPKQAQQKANKSK